MLGMVGEERQLLDVLRRRPKVWIEGVLSGEGMLKTVLESTLLGKRGKGRKRIRFLDRLKGSRPYSELKKAMLEGKGDSQNTSLVLHGNLP